VGRRDLDTFLNNPDGTEAGATAHIDDIEVRAIQLRRHQRSLAHVLTYKADI